MKTYYHFTNDTLRNGEPIPPIGEWLTIEGMLIPCQWGLHASEHPYDALGYAPGFLLHKVELDGEIISHGGDKVVARSRKIIATIDAEKLCKDFAKKAVLDILHLWRAPKVVKQYLETGDESIRQEARDLSWNCSHTNRFSFRATKAERSARSAYYFISAHTVLDGASSADYIYAAVEAACFGVDRRKYCDWFLGIVENAFQTNVSKP